jgi:hypothetical protein
MRTFLTTIFIFFTSVLYSQVETRYFDEPIDLKEVTGGHIQELPIVKAITNIPESEVKEKMIQCKQSDNPTTDRYGYPINVSYTLYDGSWNDVDGGRVWSMTFISKNATCLNFAFSNLNIPKGAEIFVVGKDNRVVFGPVTCDFINKNGSYLTDLIPGDESTIYLYEPSEYSGESTLTIEKIIHGVDNKIVGEKDLIITLEDTNVACKPNWVNSACGVAGIYNSDGINCGNGTLLMSTDLSFRPYMLLSYDKIDSNGDHVLSTTEISAAENWIFRFNRRRTTCDGTTNASAQVFYGATLRSYWYNSGFALMELNNDITSTAIRWQGWDKSSNTPSQGVCIYINGAYNNAGYLSISSENHSLYSKKCSIRNLYHWVIGLWDEGHSWGGNYGSPLFNQDYRVVGHLNHMDLNFDEITSEICFGKFPSSWTGGGTNTTRLSNWLDPAGTGQTTINTSRRVKILGPDIVCGTAGYNLLYLDSSYGVTWSFKNASYLNSLISSSPSDPTSCYITTNSSTTLDNILVATLWRNGTAIGTVEKHIITPKQLTGTVTQTGINIGSNNYPSFTIPIETFFAVNQICYITLQSPKFRYMNVSSTTNPQTNLFLNRIDEETIALKVPANTENVGVRLYFTGNGDCNDFDLRIVALRNPIDPSSPLYVNVDGSLAEIGLIEDIVNNEYSGSKKEELLSTDMPKSWALEIYEATTGKKMFSTVTKNKLLSIDTSGWNPGVYIVCCQLNGKSYSKKITIK